MRLRSLDCGRLFSAKIAFGTVPLVQLYSGDFAEPFPPPLRASLRARRSSLRRAPQGVPHPLTRGRGAAPAPALTGLYGRSGLMLHIPACNRKTTVYYDFYRLRERKTDDFHRSEMTNHSSDSGGNLRKPSSLQPQPYFARAPPTRRFFSAIFRFFAFCPHNICKNPTTKHLHLDAEMVIYECGQKIRKKRMRHTNPTT